MNKIDMLASIEAVVAELNNASEQLSESEIIDIVTEAYNMLSEIIEES